MEEPITLHAIQRDMPDRSAFFRSKAEACRKLAHSGLSDELVATLSAMERNFERLAELAEADSTAGSGTRPGSGPPGAGAPDRQGSSPE